MTRTHRPCRVDSNSSQATETQLSLRQNHVPHRPSMLSMEMKQGCRKLQHQAYILLARDPLKIVQSPQRASGTPCHHASPCFILEQHNVAHGN